MRNLTIGCAIAVLCIGCDKESQKPDALPPQTQNATAAQPAETTTADKPVETGSLEVTPLQHASMILKWNDLTIAVDPVKGALDAAAGEEPKVDLVLVTDIHGDHFDADAVASLRKPGARVIAPQAVADQGGEALPEPTILANGAKTSVLEGRVEVEAVPMYNIERKREDSGEPYHVKGRGNGYVLTLGDQRVYISGDTECIPEMKALTDIDVAFVCMNLPYTMTPEEAAGCITEFKPKKLYPYHYRDQDPTKLVELLKETPEVAIEQMEWYPAAK